MFVRLVPRAFVLVRTSCTRVVPNEFLGMRGGGDTRGMWAPTRQGTENGGVGPVGGR